MTIDRDFARVKENYPNHLLLYQIGSFYESFYQDAEEISKNVGIFLRKRKIQNKLINSCGFPCKSLDIFLRKLLDNNLSIAIANQFISKKKQIYRKVNKIFEPNDITNKNNFLVLKKEEIDSIIQYNFSKKSGKIIKDWISNNLNDSKEIERCTSLVRFLIGETGFRNDLESEIKYIKKYYFSRIDDRALKNIKECLNSFFKISEIICHKNNSSIIPKKFIDFVLKLSINSSLIKLIKSFSFKDKDFVVHDNCYNILDFFRLKKSSLLSKINELENIYKKKINKYTEIKFDESFGFYISNSIKNFSEYNSILIPKYSFINYSLYSTSELQRIEEDLLIVDSKISSIEKKIKNDIKEKIFNSIESLNKNFEIIILIEFFILLSKTYINK